MLATRVKTLYSRVYVRKIIKKQKGKFPRDLHISKLKRSIHVYSFNLHCNYPIAF